MWGFLSVSSLHLQSLQQPRLTNSFAVTQSGRKQSELLTLMPALRSYLTYSAPARINSTASMDLITAAPTFFELP